MSDKKRYGLDDTQARCFVKMIKTSPLKLNLLVRTIRNVPVAKAVDTLTFSKKRSAIDVKKALLSAIANAEANHNLDADKLVVQEAYVGKAMVLRRFRARSKGRAFKILKPFSNLTVVVGLPKVDAASEKTVKAKKAAKKGDK